jgi:hypothetical protein
MNRKQKCYFDLFFIKRINEYAKIDKLKSWSYGTARAKYNRIRSFYLDELDITNEELIEIELFFKYYKSKFDLYFNEARRDFFLKDPEKLIEWFVRQNDKCGYCEISQTSLLKFVKIRSGNLTLNNKTKRSKGTLEIEKIDPNGKYDFENCILACPLCNNAKSNLIDSKSWIDYFVKPMKKYYKKLLSDTT